MSKAMIIILSFLGCMVLVISIFAFSLMSINNTCVIQEQSIIAQYKQNQNNYDNYFKKLKETAQVPDIYVKDFKNVYDSIMSNRYGNEGSKAVFQWIQENNPTFDSNLYRQIQQVVEAGRNSFETNQKTLLDKKQIYESLLRTFPDGFIAKFMGFPKIKLEDYDIVTSDITQEIFSTKKSEPITIQ